MTNVHHDIRPEKAHSLQIDAFSKLLRGHPELKDMKLVLIGSSRNDDDGARINVLRELVSKHHLEDNVIFEINLPYSKLKEYLGRGLIGLHTMWNEHFGISVVEYMVGFVFLSIRSSRVTRISLL